ncbi:MAG TPA: M24 family metallopeptidase, partial [Gemmatimonadales bacterium]
MLQPDALPRLHAVLDAASETADGWLLFDFRGINPIMAAVVGEEIVGSRRAYVFVPRGRDPVALVHAVDAELWRGWPSAWRRIVWVRREELARELGALVGGKTVAMEYSPGGAVPYGDYVPAGTLELVRAAGAKPISSAELVTRYCSVWSPDDLAAHLRAAGILSEIAQASIRRIGERARAGDPVDEHEVTRWILEAFDLAGLETESPPSVSYGEHAARVHYEAPAEGSSPIVPGQVLLLDLWAREPGGIYADQTWMAAIGAPTARALELWNVVRGARDAALDLLRERLGAGRPV